MLNANELDDDPEVAFAQWVKHFDRQYLEAIAQDYEGNNNYDICMNYMVNVMAAASALDLKILEDWEIPEPREHYAAFTKFRLAVQFYAKRAEIGTLKGQTRFSVGLTTEQKKAIYDHIDLIRAVVEKADLPENKRSQLLLLLTNFRQEIEQKRTRFDRAAELVRRFAGLTAEVEDQVGRPAFKYIKAIWGVFDEAKEEENARLPKEPQGRELPAPPKRLEPPTRSKPQTADLDDDIPF